MGPLGKSCQWNGPGLTLQKYLFCFIQLISTTWFIIWGLPCHPTWQRDENEQQGSDKVLHQICHRRLWKLHIHYSSPWRVFHLIALLLRLIPKSNFLLLLFVGDVRFLSGRSRQAGWSFSICVYRKSSNPLRIDNPLKLIAYKSQWGRHEKKKNWVGNQKILVLILVLAPPGLRWINPVGTNGGERKTR